MRRELTNYKSFYFVYGVIFIFLIMLFTPFFCATVSAATDDEELVEQYAPILYFENEVVVYPVDVSYHLDNSYLYIYGTTIPGIAAGEIDFSEYTEYINDTESVEYVYLDNTKGTIEDTGIIDDYQQSDLDYTVYTRVTSSEGKTVIQYWMFYAFNKGDLNQHEGDWEMVQIVLSGNTPQSVMYSQHHGGQIATWDQVERDEDHIKVFVARGSHANYLRPYSGKLTSDFVSENGEVFEPTDYSRVMLDSQDWLEFPGRWGEINEVEDVFLGRAGPLGPKFKENGEIWNNPISWGMGLTQANEQIFLFEWFLYNFVTIFIVLTLLSIGLLSLFVYRRHKKYGLGPRIFSILYINGVNLKSIGNIICIVGIIVVIFALFMPWYAVSYQISGDAEFESFATEGMIDLIKIDGLTGIQLVTPPFLGSFPVSSFYMPFSLFIGIGLVFFILATIGIPKSRKLGGKYIFRGIRVMIPIIMLLLAFMIMGMLISGMIPDVGDSSVSNSITGVFEEMSSSPMSGQGTIIMSDENVNGQIDLRWGLSDGGTLLLVSGIILIIGGIIEIIARTTFFEQKVTEKTRKEKRKEKAKKSDEASSVKRDEEKPEPPKVEQTSNEKE